jgi:HPt (histidine-containing phosphotransfer) domain-containing protein
MGDRELETELLGIFERQAAQIAAQLSEEFPSSCTAGEAVRRADLAHKLKGSARAVGAFAVASAAENYEHAARAGLLRASDAAAVADAVDTARAALRDLAN